MADKLDLDEVNRLRVSMGLQALPTSNGDGGGMNFKQPSAQRSGDSSDEDEEEPASTYATRVAAADDNYRKLKAEQDAKKSKEEKRAALRKQRDAAQRNAKLQGKGLGEAAGGEDEMDTRAWLMGEKKRQKKIAKQRELMLQRELEERENQAQYTEKDLAGTKVGHELGEFDVGDEQILTLKDAAVDASDSEDELENATMREKEKLEEKLRLKRKRPIYDPNDVDENGEKSILGQYDDEDQSRKKKRFTLGDTSAFENAKASEDAADGLGSSKRVKISLDLPEQIQPASDYVDISEIKIKKPKKKKDKSRRKRDDDDEVLAAPINNSESHDSSRNTNAATRQITTPAVDDDDEDLQMQLAKQRRDALKKRKNKVADFARLIREDESTQMKIEEESEEEQLLLNETSEFVANLQDRDLDESEKPNRGKQGVASNNIKSESPGSMDEDEEDVEMKEAESEDSDAEYSRKSRIKQESHAGDDNETLENSTGLEEADTSQQGIGSLFTMLTKRGLVKGESSGDVNYTYRQQQRFLHEKQQREAEMERQARVARTKDRESGKFSRMSNKEREEHAQRENQVRDQLESRQLAQAFDASYKPNVDLKYVDEFGRQMSQKEAFKHLSHQFHGKGSGNQKTEKRLKKINDEQKRMAVSSLDSTQATAMDKAAGTQAKRNRQAGVRLQ